LKSRGRTSPVFHGMVENIRRAIEKGELKPGDWLQSEQAFAREFGISRGSVRKGFAVLAAEGLVQSFPGKGVQVINARRGELKELVVFCSYPEALSQGGFYGRIGSCLMRLCTESGISFHFVYHKGELEPYSFWNRVSFDAVTGVIFLAETSARRLPRPALFKGPVIQLDHCLPELPYDAVMVDAEMSGRMAVEHLHELGHERIAYVGWHMEAELNPERRRGVTEEMMRRGLVIKPSWFTTAADAFEGGARAFEEILDRGGDVTAVIAYHPRMARGVMYACRRRGLNVPRDVSVICFGKEREYRPGEPPLSYIDCDPEGLARKGFERLLWRSKNPRAPVERILNPVQVVQGETSGECGRAGSGE